MPAVHHHDGIEGHADDRPAPDQLPDLVVIKLAVPVRQGAAVGMARPDRAGVMIHRIPEALVTQMGGIQDQPQPLHLPQQFPAPGRQGALVIGPAAVDTRPVMGEADGPQPVGEGPLQVMRGDNGVSPFQAEDVSDGQRPGSGLPGTLLRRLGLLARRSHLLLPARGGAGRGWDIPTREVLLELGEVPDLAHLPAQFHLAVPGQLSLRVGPGLLLAGPPIHAAEIRDVAGQLSGHAKAHPAPAHLRETDRVPRPVGHVVHVQLPPANPLLGPAQIAVELQRVHRQVQMDVEDKGQRVAHVLSCKGRCSRLGLGSQGRHGRHAGHHLAGRHRNQLPAPPL